MGIVRQRSEILFIYDVTEANPNGDPLNDGRPRLDDDNHLLVTDLRIKRTIRDYWDRALDLEIFFKRVLDEKRHLATRQQRLADVESLEDLLDRFVDLPIFGMVDAVKKRPDPKKQATGTTPQRPTPRRRRHPAAYQMTLPGEEQTAMGSDDTAPFPEDDPDDRPAEAADHGETTGESPAAPEQTTEDLGPEWTVSFTGPVQFGQGRSLHRVRVHQRGLVSHLPSEANKFHGAIGHEYRVPYVLIAVYGHVDPVLAALHRWLPLSRPYHLTDEQVDLVLEGLWEGTKRLITRSKTGHMPRLLLQVLYRPDTRVFIGLLTQLCRLRLPPDCDETQIRRVEEVDLDLSLLARALRDYQDCLAAVRYKHDPRLSLIADGRPVTVRDIVPEPIPVEEIRFYGH